MKTYPLLLLFLFFFGAVHAQTDTLPSFTVKKGIYLSFKELANNEPGRTDSFHMELRTKSNIVMVGGGPYTFVLEDGKKSEFKTLRRSMVGLSDGERFYISDQLTVGGWMGFTPCVLRGPYILAPIQGSAGSYTGGGVLPSFLKTGRGYVIDIRTGANSALNKSFIRGLLKKHPDLAHAYKDKDDIMDSAVEIIMKVNELEGNGAIN